MAILLNYQGHDSTPWAEAFADMLPTIPVHIYPHIPNPLDIQYAVVWHHPHGDLINYPNLKAILNMGAGTDHLDAETELPDVPIVRLLDPDVGNDMAQYAVYWAMHFHRRFEDYRRQASRAEWLSHEVPRTAEYRVSVMGLGLIGTQIARRLALSGFKAQGWSRTEHRIDGVDTFHGSSGLQQMLSATDVLVNCLPLNRQTRYLLNSETLGQLPTGSFVINVSRGAVIDDDALIALLNSGHIAGAALDAFVEEPLPADSAYWRTANVFVTPHISGSTYAKSAARPIADNIIRIEQGKQPFPIHIPPQTT
ncbi:MAG: glyoxylate/hydroxypyruvate reductase A [Arenicella sp.]|nr:glyoxylate/hydroxypyruvate reductase A [Arenicella sp.]